MHIADGFAYARAWIYCRYRARISVLNRGAFISYLYFPRFSIYVIYFPPLPSRPVASMSHCDFVKAPQFCLHRVLTHIYVYMHAYTHTCTYTRHTYTCAERTQMRVPFSINIIQERAPVYVVSFFYLQYSESGSTSRSLLKTLAPHVIKSNHARATPRAGRSEYVVYVSHL